MQGKQYHCSGWEPTQTYLECVYQEGENGGTPNAEERETNQANQNTRVWINNCPNEREDITGNQMASELLANVAENAKGAQVVYSYHTQIKFPIPIQGSSFNLRANFSQLMNELIKMERMVIIST
eukprot:10947872-Ditylum_brightwellii.AAC.1